MLDLLLVDDVPTIRLALGEALRKLGHRVVTAEHGRAALGLLERQVFDVVVSDIRLPEVDGLTVFRWIRAHAPETDVILITSNAVVADAVAAMREGAHDYLTKPFELDELAIRLARIAERRALKRELEAARAELAAAGPREGIVGRSPAMARVLERLETFAASDAPVLITGESGTGKERVARALHQLGPRAAKPFVAVNCAAFPETLLEAELFGHESGAFTGANRRREGRFKAADGGTLFLDEVAELPPSAQAKLLRVVQEGTFEPLGTNTPVSVDVRLVSATHRHLKQRMAEGRFREDLYYRLNVLELTLPPLRERSGDLPILVEHFLRRFSQGLPRPPSITPRAWAALAEHPFPGNVRELEHCIQQAVVLARGKDIDLEHLPRDIAGAAAPRHSGEGRFRSLAEASAEFEREYLLRALNLTAGKKAQAAELLGISRKSLWQKLRAYGIGGVDEPE